MKKALFVFLVMSSSLILAQTDWQPLFDGKTLDGWEVRGGAAEYTIEDECIVGRTVEGSANTFLCTVRDYGDFILEFDVRFDPVLNSGCQIRSQVYHHDTEFPMYRDGNKIMRKHRAGDVYGYQVEISSEASGASGGVWDEARKGMWLYNAIENPDDAKPLKDNQWNKFRIECIGPHIKTFINGVKVADFIDTTDLSGFIGLQVHSVPKGTKAEVRWKNIRIKDLGRAVWKPLFNGFDFDGFHKLPGGKWSIENGIIIGKTPVTETKHGLLVTDEIYTDFTAKIKYRAVKGNSGLYFRVEESGDAVGVHGFQAEIDAEKDAGGLYETAGRAWVIQPKPEDTLKWFKPNEWNEMTVYAVGRHVVVHVNGYKTAELLNDPGRIKGKLAIQMHGGQDMEIQVKDLSILKKGKVTRPFNGRDLTGWTTNKGSGKKDLWTVGTPVVSKDNPAIFEIIDGNPAIINNTTHHGDSRDFYTTTKFGSCHIDLEVMVPRGSNSGIYLMGEYEVQVLDSFGKTGKMGGGDMGAIYGAAPPQINASKAPGQWQKYSIDWQAPKFDASGKKIQNARFINVTLNGMILHENLEMPKNTPGGVDGREKPTGPMMFQGNHGPVAYRNITITEW